MEKNIQDRITLFFDHELNEKDSQNLLNQVNNDPAFNKLFQKEQHLRQMIKSRVKRPAASPDLIQSIKDNIKIS